MKDFLTLHQKILMPGTKKDFCQMKLESQQIKIKELLTLTTSYTIQAGMLIKPLL